MRIKKIMCAICIVILTQYSIDSVSTFASESLENESKKSVFFEDGDMNEKVAEFIEENYKDGGEVIDNFEESELYHCLQNGESNELEELDVESISEIKEIVCYIEVKANVCEKDRYNIYNEEDFKEYIEENDIDIQEDNLNIENCSWTGGKKYYKDSSDGYMKLIFSSVRNSDYNQYSMFLNFTWLKQPRNTNFDNYLCFGHDSNMTVDNDSIRFHFYHYKKVVSGTTSSTTIDYDINDTKNVSVTPNGIKVKFDIGSSAGIYELDERRQGFLTFKASFVSNAVQSSQLYFSYYQPYFSISAIWSSVISVSSGGKITIAALTTGAEYAFSNEFRRK